MKVSLMPPPAPAFAESCLADLALVFRGLQIIPVDQLDLSIPASLSMMGLSVMVIKSAITCSFPGWRWVAGLAYNEWNQ